VEVHDADDSTEFGEGKSMGDLEKDTEVWLVGDESRALLREDWSMWGPFGGYLAAVALRAAGLSIPEYVPASISCAFLAVPAFAEVTLHTRVLRQTRRAAAVTVSMSQDGKTILDARVWGTTGADGFEHDAVDMPAVASPNGLRPSETEELLEIYPAVRNLSLRVLEPERPGEARMRAWARFQPESVFQDPWVDCCRSVVLVDLPGYPAAVNRHGSDNGFYAPSLDLHLQFHRPVGAGDWLLVDGHSPAAAAGVLAWHNQIFSIDGQMIASGIGQSLCRPIPR
jgi:acyl-CoA thioesterase II